MSCPRSTPAGRRYFRDMLFASLLYVVCVLGANLVIAHLEPAMWLKVLLAIVPTIPAALMLFTMVMFVRSMDEFEQRVMTEATMIAAGVVGIASFTWGFIESVTGFGRVELIWILPALILVQSVAAPLVRRRYQ